jgi:hypothetical protein
MVQYFVLLEIKSLVRTKKLYYQLLLFSVCGYAYKGTVSRVPTRLASVPGIDRPAPQHFPQHTPTIDARVDKNYYDNQ